MKERDRDRYRRRSRREREREFMMWTIIEKRGKVKMEGEEGLEGENKQETKSCRLMKN